MGTPAFARRFRDELRLGEPEQASMTRETARQLVKQMAETGRLIQELRWRELAALDDDRARQAADALIDAALRVPLPSARRTGSGLVQQQAIFQRASRR